MKDVREKLVKLGLAYNFLNRDRSLIACFAIEHYKFYGKLLIGGNTMSHGVIKTLLQPQMFPVIHFKAQGEK